VHAASWETAAAVAWPMYHTTYSSKTASCSSLLVESSYTFYNETV